MKKKSLFILHCLWDLPAYSRLFLSDDIMQTFNLPGCFNKNEIINQLILLENNGLVVIGGEEKINSRLTEEFYAGNCSVALTRRGGDLWGEYINPNWNIYLSDIDVNNSEDKFWFLTIKSKDMRRIHSAINFMDSSFPGVFNFSVRRDDNLLYWGGDNCQSLKATFKSGVPEDFYVLDEMIEEIYMEMSFYYEEWDAHIRDRYLNAINSLEA